MNVTPDLDARFREAALREGLVDVRFDIVRLPGRRAVRRRDRPRPRPHLVPARGHGGGARAHLRQCACSARRSTTCAASSTSTSRASAASSTCHSICASRRSTPMCSDELALVPYGRTDTYGSLAAKVGRPRAARAVGTVMNRNPIPIVLPVPPHRRRERLAHRLRGRPRREAAPACSSKARHSVRRCRRSSSSEEASAGCSQSAASGAPRSR